MFKFKKKLLAGAAREDIKKKKKRNCFRKSEKEREGSTLGMSEEEKTEVG